MSLLFPDVVEITPVTLDASYRTETEGTPFQVRAYVEEDSHIKYGSDGQPIQPLIRVFVPRLTDILKTYFLKIVKLHGETPVAEYIIRRRVKRASPVGGSRQTHIEALV